MIKLRAHLFKVYFDYPSQIHPPPWYGRGGGSVEKIERLTRVFDMLQYFEKDFPVESF